MIARLATCLLLMSLALSTAVETQVPSESAIRFLTKEPAANDYGAYFSPDSRSVVFSRRADGGTTSQLFLVSTAGGQANALLQAHVPVSATRASWSPHNNLIAFTGTFADGRNTIWLVKGDGTEPRHLQVAGVSDQVYYPSWYPDGRHLAFLDARDRVIRRIDRESARLVTLTDPRDVFAGMPSVSPDGKWIAFAGQKNVGQRYDQTKNSIWLLSDQGTTRPLEDTHAQGRTPAWSPDGEWVTFESNRGSADPSLYAVFIIRRDGAGIRQLTPHHINANHPIWSGDGRYVTFSARHTSGSTRTGIAILEVPK